MNNIKSAVEILKSSIAFLTILPVKSDIKTAEDFRKIICFFPLTGLILGVYYYICAYVAHGISRSIFFAAIIYTAMTVILTGGLHYDGLADSFDGLLSGKDRNKTLEIMSDSRIGTFGVLSIVINIMLKLGIIYVMIQEGIVNFVIFAPAFSRTAQVVFAYFSSYAKDDGMGNIFIGKIKKSELIFVTMSFLLLSLSVLLIFNPYDRVFTVFAISVLLSCVILSSLKKSVEKKIGGITGDILGMVAEIGETTFLYMVFIVAQIYELIKNYF